MGTHGGNNIKERVGHSDDAHGGRGVPDIVHEERDGLIAVMLAIGADEEFVSDVVEIFGAHAVIAVKRGDDDIFCAEMFFLDVGGELVAGVGEIGAFADDFVLEIGGVFDEEKIAEGIFEEGLESFGIFFHSRTTAFFVAEDKNNPFVRKSTIANGFYGRD